MCLSQLLRRGEDVGGAAIAADGDDRRIVFGEDQVGARRMGADAGDVIVLQRQGRIEIAHRQVDAGQVGHG